MMLAGFPLDLDQWFPRGQIPIDIETVGTNSLSDKLTEIHDEGDG